MDTYEIIDSLNILIEWTPYFFIMIAFGMGYIEFDWDLWNYIKKYSMGVKQYVIKTFKKSHE
jgi:hypothetical protein